MGGEALRCRSRHHPGRDGDVRLQLVLSNRLYPIAAAQFSTPVRT
jgi:hypothetical protein